MEGLLDRAEFLQPLIETVSAYAPRLLGAVGLLLLFWVGAWIAGAATRGLVGRIRRGSKIDRSLQEGGPRQPEVAAGKIVYLIVFLVGLLAFFNALGLTIVSEPINGMLSQVMEYLPRLLSAGLLLAIGWFVARLVRTMSRGAIDSIDSRRLPAAANEPAARQTLGASISSFLYWLTLLAFLPLVLDALEMQGMLAPVQSMFDEMLAYLPNLLAGTVILLVGWLVARTVRGVVTNLLASTRVDAGVQKLVGSERVRLSALAGVIVYALILLPVIIASLDALALESLATPIQGILATILDHVPGILTGALILTVAFLIGRLLSRLVTELLGGMGFDALVARTGLKLGANWTPTRVVGSLVLAAAIILGGIEGTRIAGLTVFSDLLVQFGGFAGRIFLGLAVLGLGLFAARWAGHLARAAFGSESSMAVGAFRATIVILATAMALRQIGIADDIVRLAFGILLGAVALAFAIAFGVGGREFASKRLENWRGGNDGNDGGQMVRTSSGAVGQ